MSAISTWVSRIKVSIKAHKWIWAGSGAAVVAVAVVAGLYFGGFFGPSGRAICKVAVDRAKAYGALTPSAKQDGSAKRTDVNDRKTCMVADGSDKYVVTVDLKCKDLKNDDCLPIYSVEREDGLSLYQVRTVPNDAEDVASVPPAGSADGAPQGAQGVAPSGPDNAATVDADIEVAHPDASGAAPQ